MVSVGILDRFIDSRALQLTLHKVECPPIGLLCYDPGETTDDDEDSGGRALRDEG